MKIPGSDYFFLCTEQLITQPGLYFHTTGQLTSSEHAKCRLHLLLHLFVSEETQRERERGGGALLSTSQAMSSQARHRGKYRLVCRIHPWIDPTSMCGRVVADHILSTATLKRIPRLHLERVCKGAGIKVWNGYGCWTNLGPEQPGGN